MSIQLIHGDCLEVMPTLPANSIQMVFADLPYGALSWKHWDIPIDLAALWPLLYRTAHPRAAMIFTATLRFAYALMSTNMKGFSYDLVFEKKLSSNPMLAKKRPLGVHEHILVFNGPRTYNPQMRPAVMRKGVRPEWDGNNQQCKFYNISWSKKTRMSGPMYPRSVLSEMCEAKNKIVHSTQKPVALLEWLIRTYTNEGDTVLDPAAGSGTTAIAALRTGRKAICIEKDKQYYEAMCRRVEAEQAQLRMGL